MNSFSLTGMQSLRIRRVTGGDGTTKRRKGFTLLALPPELWSHIVELVVIGIEPIKVLSKLGWKQNESTVIQPGISRTCRLLRRHTLSLFYERNIFIAYNHMALPEQLVSWVSAIGWTNRARLRQLYIQGCGTHTLDEIEELCIDVGITLPFHKDKTDAFSGPRLYQLSFVELKPTQDEQTPQPNNNNEQTAR